MRKALAILFVLGFGMAVWWLGLAQPRESSSRQDGEVEADMAGTWQSGIKVQNLNPTTATVSLQFINQNGSNVGDAVATALGPWASREFYLTELSIPDGRYSAVVRSDAPVAAVTTQTNYGAGLADSYPASGGAARVEIPNLYRGLNDWYSAIFVQNAGNTEATVKVRVDRPGGDPLLVTAQVLPRGAKAFDMQSKAFGALGTRFRGTASVYTDSGHPLVVTVFHTRLAGAVKILASPLGSAATPPSTILALPSLYRRLNDWNSAIQLLNPSATQTITATVIFRRDFNWLTGGPWVKSGIVIPPRGTYEFSLDSDTLGASSVSGEAAEQAPEGEVAAEESPTAAGYLPDGFRGTAAVVGTGPIHAQVMHTNYVRSMGMGYQATAHETLTSRLAFPSLYANFGQGPWTSGLKVQNRTNRQVTINFTFKADDGVLEGRTWRRTGLVLPPLGSVEIYLATSPMDGGSPLPAGFRGSAVVEATDPTIKLAGTAVHTNYWRGVANIYTGISF